MSEDKTLKKTGVKEENPDPAPSTPEEPQKKWPATYGDDTAGCSLLVKGGHRVN